MVFLLQIEMTFLIKATTNSLIFFNLIREIRGKNLFINQLLFFVHYWQLQPL